MTYIIDRFLKTITLLILHSHTVNKYFDTSKKKYGNCDSAIYLIRKVNNVLTLVITYTA